MSIQVKKDIISSGFVPKAEKSMWTPTKNLTFLGTHIDTDKGIFTIPDNRIDKIMSTISDIDMCLTKSGKVFVRKVASLVGQIISTSPVIGNIVYLMTKHLSIDINSVHSWNSYIHLSVDSIDQINFWRFNLHEANVKPFKTDVSWQTIVYSDASNTGYGCYIVENPYNIANGTWLEIEISTSSTWKELTAVKTVFLSLINFLNGKNVKWFIDNQNFVSIVSKGSTKSVLQKLALDIFSTCIKHNVNIDMAFAGELQNLPVSLLSKVNLLPELLSESRAASTTKGYYQSFLRWKKWAILNGIENCDILPAKAFHVAIYLASLTQSSNTVSPVVQAFYSLKWIHSLIGSLCSPTDSSLVINVLEGAKRSLATPTNKKEPISVELLHKMYDAMFSFGNLYNQQEKDDIKTETLLRFVSNLFYKDGSSDPLYAATYLRDKGNSIHTNNENERIKI
ncbi:unnamed protein product [Mytilus edulis]|uniref:Uncharacterized protein n=1 Tax=Mytilus edulis TaxID=6550 RepID=A0A8S3U8J5_MYTED|nr:unnamed protein product [Mytilus edulis]